MPPEQVPLLSPPVATDGQDTIFDEDMAGGLFQGQEEEVEKDLALTYEPLQVATELVHANTASEHEDQLAVANVLLQMDHLPPIESVYPQGIPSQLYDDDAAADDNADALSDIDMSDESMAEGQMFAKKTVAEVSTDEQVSLGTFLIGPKYCVLPVHQTAYYIILLLCSCYRMEAPNRRRRRRKVAPNRRGKMTWI